MTITTCRAGEMSVDLLATWLLLQQENAALASPFFCPEFTQAASVACGNVEVAVLRDGGQVVGFFPFQRGARNVGLPAGGIFSDYQGLICAQGFECDPRELLKGCRLIAWDFDHLLVSQACFTPFHLYQELSPQIDVSRGYAAYVNERRATGSEQIKKCGNFLRRLEREVGPVRFVAQSTETAPLQQTITWKSRQFRAGGNTDLFAPDWARSMVEIIHARQSVEFAGMLSLLYAGERLVAGHFGMRSRTMWHYWFPAYDPEMARYSPGLILLLKMAEHAPSVGLGIIDMGKGLCLYKERLMSQAVKLAVGSVVRPSLLALRRAARRRLHATVAASPLAGPARRLVRWARGTPHKP